MNECVALVLRYWQGKSELFREMSQHLPLCQPQIWQGLVWDWTQASAVGSWWLSEPWCGHMLLLLAEKWTSNFLNTQEILWLA